MVELEELSNMVLIVNSSLSSFAAELVVAFDVIFAFVKRTG